MAGISSLFTAEALTSADVAYAQIVGATDAEVFLEGLADLRDELVSLLRAGGRNGESEAIENFIEAIYVPPWYQNRGPVSQREYRQYIAEMIRARHSLFKQAASSFLGTTRFATRGRIVAKLKALVVRTETRAIPASIEFLKKLGSEARLDEAQQTMLEKIFGSIPVEELHLSPSIYRIMILLRTAITGNLRVTRIFPQKISPEMRLEKLALTDDGRTIWKWEPSPPDRESEAADWVNAFFMDTLSILEPNPVLVVSLIDTSVLDEDHMQALGETFFRPHPEEGILIVAGMSPQRDYVVPRRTGPRLEYSTAFLKTYPEFATPADIERLGEEAQRELDGGKILDGTAEEVLVRVFRRGRSRTRRDLALEKIKRLTSQRRLYFQAKAVLTELPVLLHQLEEASAREDEDKVYELTAIALLMNDGHSAIRNHPHPLARFMFFRLLSEEREECSSFWPEEQENIERDLRSNNSLVRKYAVVELAGFGLGFGGDAGLESARQKLRKVVEDLKTQPGREEEYEYVRALSDHIAEKIRGAQKAEAERE
ncbi:MAG: hypothetical protein A3H42_03530 [Deltaproteobacteria bacterium RIFCSPLOWO2_02_FULL_46_8]|nr:MAG: hypothetical protein A3H42_03530 [Deltaproteobacteria bacterium RIFCSPLOWO2_02_FULL_46_8]